jgi:hypothetical protein
VGGSTWIPYIRLQLQEKFAIPLHTAVNPLHAVALGACRFAGNEKKKREISTEEWFQLEYERITQKDSCLLAGKTLKPLPPHSLILLRFGTSHAVQTIELNAKGMFVSRLPLKNEGENTFELQILSEKEEIKGIQNIVVFRGQKLQRLL